MLDHIAFQEGWAHPVLSCADSAKLEERVLGTDEAKVWAAMTRAGRAVGRAVLRDYLEIGPLPDRLKVLLLVGSGHNGGDALIAGREILSRCPEAEVTLLLARPRSMLRPLVSRALDELIAASLPQSDRHGGAHCPPRARVVEWAHVAEVRLPRFHICLDGLLGMSFKPPLRGDYGDIVEWANEEVEARLRAAVDVPSGLGDDSAEGPAFSAHFTYGTGILKRPALARQSARFTGRPRYLDIGFFEDLANLEGLGIRSGILTPQVLAPLRGLRGARKDKRHFGHPLLIGGSQNMPGALLMAATAASRAGSGLVTAMIPEKVAAVLAPARPEVMWMPAAVSDSGSLSVANFNLIEEKAEKHTALLVGPGMVPDADTLPLMCRIVEEIRLPMVLDAGALHPDVIECVERRTGDFGEVVVTPHLGEFKRICPDDDSGGSDESLREFAEVSNLTCVLKGAPTRISDGEAVVVSPFGGPVLARGGSGDILAGMIAAQVSRVEGSETGEVFRATCRACAWHGLAAEMTARRNGQEAVWTTEILEALPAVLREDMEPPEADTCRY